MTPHDFELPEILYNSRPKMVFGPGALGALGALARELGGTRVLVVSDPGIVGAGHVARAVGSLTGAGLSAAVFSAVEENPSEDHVAAASAAARDHRTDFIVGLGGGSAMDTAKGCNFVLTNGGRMKDYWGLNRASKPLLPMIAIPTTAGTGSEAQSFALIRDPQTHQKMACGDAKALPRVAILDPDLIATVPSRVAAAAGIDAVAHAVETSACNKRTELSRLLSREAWKRLSVAFPKSLLGAAEPTVRADMLLGAHLAGAAIEASMLGAAHACANPLTAEFGVTHGVAVGLMLPHVVRFNARGHNPYGDLDSSGESLACAIERLLDAARLPRRLSDLGVPTESLRKLAVMAAQQWTAQFNPTPVGETELLAIYLAAAANR